MARMGRSLDVTDTSTWWRLARDQPLTAPGLRIDDLGLDGRDHHAPYHPHWRRPRYGWIYLLAGKGFYESSACGRVDLEPGDVAVCQPGHWHNYGPLPGESWIEVFCFVEGGVCDVLLSQGNLPTAPVLRAGLGDPIRADFLDLVVQGRRGEAAEAAARWYRLAARLAPCPTRLAPPRRERHAAELQAIADQLCADPGRDWNFIRLAESVGLGHDAFRKAFTRRYRMPPQAFLQRERIHRACALLWWGQRVQDVAAAVGFSDPFHFSRVFKRCLGQSPRQFLATSRSQVR